jgi:hypothetical protein
MKYLISTVAVLLVFAACKKVETPLSRQEELRNGKWLRSNLKIQYNPYIGKDTLLPYYDSLMPSCLKDNYIVFGINHDGALKSGSNKCPNVPDPDSVSFYWSLEDNGARITFLNANNMFFDSSTIDAKFEEYTANRFVISYVDYPPNAINQMKKDTITYFYTFTKF